MSKTPESRLAEFIALGEMRVTFASPKHHRIDCFSTIQERPCPHFGEFSSVGNYKRISKVRDVPLRVSAPPITIYLTKRRFKCNTCNKVFTEVIDGIKKFRRTTERFRQLVMWSCDRFSSLKQVRKDFKVSSDFVYRAFYEQLELKRRKNKQYPWPKEIGIDEHGFGRDRETERKVFVSMIVNQEKKPSIRGLNLPLTVA